MTDIEAVVVSKTPQVLGRVGQNVLCRSLHDFSGYRPAIIIGPGTAPGTWRAKVLFNEDEEDLSDPKIDTQGVMARLRLYRKSIRPGERRPEGCNDLVWLETADIGGGATDEAVQDLAQQVETLAAEVARQSETSAEIAIQKAEQAIELANKALDKQAESNKRLNARIEELASEANLVAEALGRLVQAVDELTDLREKPKA